jgi:hypothetical protein
MAVFSASIHEQLVEADFNNMINFVLNQNCINNLVVWKSLLFYKEKLGVILFLIEITSRTFKWCRNVYFIEEY